LFDPKFDGVPEAAQSVTETATPPCLNPIYVRFLTLLFSASGVETISLTEENLLKSFSDSMEMKVIVVRLNLSGIALPCPSAAFGQPVKLQGTNNN